MAFEYSGKILTFENGRQVTLPHEVDSGETLEIDHYIIVPMHGIGHRNIWCFDQEGNKLWEIEPSRFERVYQHCNIDEQGRLIVSDQVADTFVVDLKNGYIELIEGERVASYEKANARIRQRRAERLMAEQDSS